MKINEPDVEELSRKIRYAVDHDPHAKDAYDKIARRIEVKSGITTTAKDVSDFINRRRPMTDGAQIVILEFAEQHGIRSK